MAGVAGFQAQVAGVMEVFANAAVEEICALLERSFTQLQEEILKQQKENSGLRRKLKILEIRETFSKRSHRPRTADCRTSGRMVRVRIRSVDTHRLSDSVGTPRAPENLISASVPEGVQSVLQCVEDEDPDVLIIKEERVDTTRSKEPNLQQNLGEPDRQQKLGEDQQNQFTSSEDRQDFLEQNSERISQQQQCEQEDFLKEENLEQRVAEDNRDDQMIHGNPQESGSAPEPSNDLHPVANTSWEGSRFEAAGHGLTYPSPDCSAGPSASEYYIHGATGETLCFGTQINLNSSVLPDVNGRLACGEELPGVDLSLPQCEVPPYKPGFPPQLMKERFVCKFCGKAFPNTSALVLHQRVHTGEKPYYCTLCGKRFSQSSSLKKHFSIHLGEKPFRCVHCGKQFSDQSNLRKHVNVHTGEKPYGCSQCGKTFNQSSNLKTHMKIHTREKPFGCERCGQIFAYKNSLLKHQQKNCLLQQSPAGQFYDPDH